MTERKNLVCPYCGHQLYFEFEWSGRAYLQERVLGSIVCSDFACDASWKPNGQLRYAPGEESAEWARKYGA